MRGHVLMFLMIAISSTSRAQGATLTQLEQRVALLEFAVQSVLLQMQHMNAPKRFHCMLSTETTVFSASGESKIEAKAKTLKACKDDCANRNKEVGFVAEVLNPLNKVCDIAALVCDD